MKILLMTILLVVVCSKVFADDFDFGTFMSNESKQHTFQITNTTESALQLGKVRSSCGCTEAKYSKNILEPGESADFTIGLKANSLSGAFAKTIYVETNHPKQKFFRFVLKGNALPLLTATPEPLLFAGVLEPQKVYEYTFELTPIADDVMLALPDDFAIENGTAILVKKAKTWILTVKIITPDMDRPFEVKIPVQVKNPAGWADLEFVISGKVQKTPALSPVAEKIVP